MLTINEEIECWVSTRYRSQRPATLPKLGIGGEATLRSNHWLGRQSTKHARSRPRS